MNKRFLYLLLFAGSGFLQGAWTVGEKYHVGPEIASWQWIVICLLGVYFGLMLVWEDGK